MNIMSLYICLALGALTGGGAVRLIDLEEGSLFTKCIKISDLQTKSIEDDIELVDRDEVSGCCPGATEPGIKFTTNDGDNEKLEYTGPQIVCGWKGNGEVDYDIERDSTNGLQTCNFNNCFVMKSNLDCGDGSKQMINGCCVATTEMWASSECDEDSCGFKDDCKNYVRSVTALNYSNGRVVHCPIYHTDWRARGREGTRTDEDDVDTSGDTPKLVTNNPRVYSRCEGGFVDRTTDIDEALLPASASEVADCRSDQDYEFTPGVQCTGCAQDGVEIRNWQRTEGGCISAIYDALSEANTSLKLEDYPCVTVERDPSGQVVEKCTMHAGCGTESAAKDDTKSCLFKAHVKDCSGSCDSASGATDTGNAATSGESSSISTRSNSVSAGMFGFVAISSVMQMFPVIW